MGYGSGDTQSPLPLSILLHSKSLFDFPAFEMADSFGLETKPALIVAVDCGEVSSGFQAISSSGTSAFDKPDILVFCVDLANRAILLLKGDGKEFSFCGGDEVCDFVCDVVFHSEKNLPEDAKHGNKKNQKKTFTKDLFILDGLCLA